MHYDIIRSITRLQTDNLTIITFSDSKPKSVSHHLFRNNIRNNERVLSEMTNYDIYGHTTRLHTILQHSWHCKGELCVLQILKLFTHTYHVSDYNTYLNLNDPQSRNLFGNSHIIWLSNNYNR